MVLHIFLPAAQQLSVANAMYRTENLNPSAVFCHFNASADILFEDMRCLE